MKPLIQLKNVSKTYGKGESSVAALKSVNLIVLPGEFIALTGPSGAGKSTLMHLLGCLDSPDRGEYKLEGSDIAHLTRRELALIRNRHMGFVFQQFFLLDDLNVTENVRLPMVYGGIDDKIAGQKAETLLGQVGLSHRQNHFPRELSGGQKQRVAIARSLAMEPKVLFADEPTGSLDSDSSGQIMRLFQQINEEQGVTIILVTHDPNIANQAKRKIIINDGNIIEDKARVEC